MSGKEQSAGSTPLSESAVQDFRKSLRGKMIRQSDEEYEEARKVWNGMIDRYPAMIVRCAGTADVVASVNFARAHGMVVAIRGGAHNVAGNATCDGGMVIDLSRMKSITIDPEARTARAEPGLTWAEFDRETQAFGLATTGGLVSSTGIAGFTTGGGIGWLVRKHGLACDNLLSVDVVTADGRLLKASSRENPDLFWGVRGGGGNLGIVTSFEYRLHPIGPMVLGGMVLHPAERAGELLRFYRGFAANAPDELTTLVVFLTAPPAPFVPESLQGHPAVAVAACYTGRPEDGAEVVRPLKEFGPPVVDLLGPIPYVALQSMFDESAPAGLQNYWKSEYLRGLDDETIDLLVDHARGKLSPLSAVHVHQLGGAMGKGPEGGSAFAHREFPFLLNIISMWTDPAETEDNVRWARELHRAVQPPSGDAVYVNFMGEEGADRVRAAYGDATYRRLVDLKDRYDPTNFFRLNQNIQPSSGQSRQEAA